MIVAILSFAPTSSRQQRCSTGGSRLDSWYGYTHISATGNKFVPSQTKTPGGGSEASFKAGVTLASVDVGSRVSFIVGLTAGGTTPWGGFLVGLAEAPWGKIVKLSVEAATGKVSLNVEELPTQSTSTHPAGGAPFSAKISRRLNCGCADGGNATTFTEKFTVSFVAAEGTPSAPTHALNPKPKPQTLHAGTHQRRHR